MNELTTEIGGTVVISGGTLWFLARSIINHYFKKEEELKKLEAKLSSANIQIIELSFKNVTEQLEKDINGIGKKLRDFEDKIDNRIKELIRLETRGSI